MDETPVLSRIVVEKSVTSIFLVSESENCLGNAFKNKNEYFSVSSFVSEMKTFAPMKQMLLKYKNFSKIYNTPLFITRVLSAFPHCFSSLNLLRSYLEAFYLFQPYKRKFGVVF